ncbi:MAG: HAMP domain-containing protein [Gammaproteobacteria bacterium]|nr:HAMP domain-containing protein [Gammaproteobacteria bacterium]
MTIKLKYKIFLSILLLLMSAMGSMVLLLEESYDQTFLSYVNEYEKEAQENLIENLEDLYHLNGNWEFIRSNQDLWTDVVAENFARAKLKRDRKYEALPTSDIIIDPLLQEQEKNRMSRREKRFYRSNIALIDSTRNHVVGQTDFIIEETEYKPLVSEERDIIGFLVARPLARILETPEIEFSNLQLSGIKITAIIIAVLTLILSIPLSRYLVGKISVIANGARELTSGNYQFRIQEGTDDEFGELTDDFNHLATTLEKNEKARNRWIADISHELRTPLTILRGEIEAVQDKVRELTPDTIDNIHSEVVNLDRLVNDLHELSMSDIGALSYHKQKLDLVDQLQQSASFYHDAFESEGIDLSCDVMSDGPLYIHGDSDRINQLFLNLMANSLRYTDKPGKLDIAITHNNAKVIIEFNDTMPAVVEKDLDKLFDRLYRVESSRSRDTGGSGLGLAICKNIIDAHQGMITASQSTLGGLRIHIEFPLEK